MVKGKANRGPQRVGGAAPKFPQNSGFILPMRWMLQSVLLLTRFPLMIVPPGSVVLVIAYFENCSNDIDAALLLFLFDRRSFGASLLSRADTCIVSLGLGRALGLGVQCTPAYVNEYRQNNHNADNHLLHVGLLAQQVQTVADDLHQ